MDELEFRDQEKKEEEKKAAPVKTRVFKPERTLKKKAGDGGFRKDDILKAQSEIDHCEIDFCPVAEKILSTLKEILEIVERGEMDEKEAAEQILHPILQLRAQGAMFRYPTYAEISTEIVSFLEDVKKVDRTVLNLVWNFYRGAVAINKMQIHDPSHEVIKAFQTELSS
ncbi:MAG: hypothetical protein OXT65_05565, partial [Alphaproteobacteria bacterium]|nr:hypothetical protein [Alphaproteobacteria bacterium]